MGQQEPFLRLQTNELVCRRLDCIRCGLLHGPLTLSQLAGSVSLIFEKRIVSIDEHSGEGKETGSPEGPSGRGGVDGRV